MREELNLTAKRVMTVLDPLELEIVNRDEDYNEPCLIENNPSDENAGTRTVMLGKRIYIERSDFALDPPPKYHRLTLGGVVRLKGAYIVRCTDCEKKNGEVMKVYAEIIEDTKSGGASPVKAKGVIHWVNKTDCVDVEARLYDYLLKEGDEEKDFSERMNPDSLVIKNAKGESCLKDAKPLEAFQFMRQGYFCRDSKNTDRLVFNRTVELKDSFKPKK